MALNIKIEPSDSSSSIEDLTSDSGYPDIIMPEQPPRPGTPDTHCSICLEELDNKCHSDACWHKFCFECLKRWSHIEPSCPLCKKNFRQIHHSFVDETSTEVYEVPILPADEISRLVIRPLTQMSEETRTFRMNLFLDIVRRNGGRNNPGYNSPRTPPIRDYNFNIGLHTISSYDRSASNLSPVGNLVSSADFLVNVTGQIMRRRVYEDNMWAQPLPDLSGRFRDCSSAFFRDNPAQTYRLHGFILRDVTVLRGITMFDIRVHLRSGINEEVLTNMIMRSLLLCEIRDINMINMLRPYFTDYAIHFVHELYNYANSPYDLVGYDRNVRYVDGHLHNHTLAAFNDHHEIPDIDLVELSPVPLAMPMNTSLIIINDSIEPIVVDTDEDDDPIVVTSTSSTLNPSEVIEINTTSDESDIEFINGPEIITDVYSRNQPSTSTGIRESFARPNTRYNLRRCRLFQSTLNRQSRYSNHLSENGPIDRIVLDSSSDEEVIETTSRGTQTTPRKSTGLFGKRRKKIKKSKLKKKKIAVETRSEVRNGSRTRSDSESSSGETDTRTNRNYLNIFSVNS